MKNVARYEVWSEVTRTVDGRHTLKIGMEQLACALRSYILAPIDWYGSCGGQLTLDAP